MATPKIVGMLDNGLTGIICLLEKVILQRITIVNRLVDVSNVTELEHLVEQMRSENIALRQQMELMREEMDYMARGPPAQYAYLHRCYPGLCIDEPPLNYNGNNEIPHSGAPDVIISLDAEPLLFDKLLRVQRWLVAHGVAFELWGVAAGQFLAGLAAAKYARATVPLWLQAIDAVYCEQLLRHYNWQRLLQWDGLKPKPNQLVHQFLKQYFAVCESVREDGHFDHQKIRVVTLLYHHHYERIADVKWEEITSLSQLQGVVMSRFTPYDRFPGEPREPREKKAVQKYVKVSETEDGLAVYRKDFGLSAKPSKASLKSMPSMKLVLTLNVDIHGSPTMAPVNQPVLGQPLGL